MIKKIVTIRKSKEVTQYHITFEDETSVLTELTFYRDKIWLNSNDFHLLEDFQKFYTNSLLRTNLFKDRLRLVVHDKSKLVLSCNENFLDAVYSVFEDEITFK
ncbi:hypothetical protein JOC95_002020 [Bacillus tianshenii]|uniref:Uncharacterized protein n=1 Tax=Sutcliffiella tianshenii TaxID=1463404 RepID=A0ABS2NZU0_9BACI|nr:hypothetical protein [Bacillus tianshenii]MBM7620167.1 hypothetical protein [Bacillus tianshenii]